MVDDMMCLIRDILQRGNLPRKELIRKICYAQGYQRSGIKVASKIDGYIRAGSRCSVAFKLGDEIHLFARSISDYERNDLKVNFLAAIAAQGTSYVEREKAVRAFARWMGFARTGPIIEDTAQSLINGLLRENRLEARGHEIRRL